MSPQSLKVKSEELNPRRRPSQSRSREKTQQILEVTAELLEREGIDNLTTLMIAKELGISVGSLYHYFPNKHAILNRLGVLWLEEMTSALVEIEGIAVEELDLDVVIDAIIERLLAVYTNQRAVLPLAQALCAIPELRYLDAEHDELFISHITVILRRLGFRSTENELNRLGRVFLEISHTVLIVAVDQRPIRSRRTLEDLKLISKTLFESHLGDTRSVTGKVEPP